MKNCVFCDDEKKLDSSLLYTGRYWKVYLANNQDYIGRLIITTKKHCCSLIDKDNDQIIELFEIIKHFEKKLTNKLNTIMFNYCYLMNSFANLDKSLWHVHIHMIPRTSEPIIINNRKYIDSEYGKHYIPNRQIQIPLEDRNYLIDLLKD